MIDVADNNAAYYYHFDGLGSVVALSNSNGDSCQSYEYSAYGQVAASDPNFIANPYMFTGRRFDIETGLYYYRARYYNPHIGRFMQTDPVGYDDGINWYAYCGNNPVGRIDPSGLDDYWQASGNMALIPNGLNPVQGGGGPADLMGLLIYASPAITTYPGFQILATAVATQIQTGINIASWAFSWQTCLRPYIQVFQYEDKNNNEEYDRGDWIDPYSISWVEVVGVFTVADQDDCLYIPGFGYRPKDWVDAIRGAWIAMQYFPYVVPEEYIDNIVEDSHVSYPWGQAVWTLADIIGGNWGQIVAIGHGLWQQLPGIEQKGEDKWWVPGVGYVDGQGQKLP